MNDELRQDLKNQISQCPDWFDWSEPEKPDYDEEDRSDWYDENEGLYGTL